MGTSRAIDDVITEQATITDPGSRNELLVSDIMTEQILGEILIQLRLMNIKLSHMSNVDIDKEDIGGVYDG
jgi:hypothetical protein